MTENDRTATGAASADAGTAERPRRAGSFVLRGADILVPPLATDAEAAAGLAADPAAAEAFPLPPGCAWTDIPLPSGPEECVRALRVPEATPLPEGWRTLLLRSAIWNAAAAGTEAGSAGLLFRAAHVTAWLDDSRHCGSCGAANGMADDEFARLCPRCGKRAYPRISPAVIVLVADRAGRILLAHNTKFRPGLRSLVAGFVEAGESLEQAVAREVKEEVGLEVSGVRYVASQPWPFPDSLMAGFAADCDGGDPVPDGIEIDEAAWYGREELPEVPAPGSVARNLIDAWLAGRLP